jgi:hypothetical protein
MNRDMTRVSLMFVADRFNAWLRFGQPIDVEIVDDELRRAYFAPRSVFAYVRWSANDYGTREWNLMVLRARDLAERMYRVRGVEPGAEVLLSVCGAARVRRALALIDAIERAGIPAEQVSPSYWSAVHGRIAANVEVRAYGRAEHEASRQRAALS